jgi:hypothetical protein
VHYLPRRTDVVSPITTRAGQSGKARLGSQHIVAPNAGHAPKDGPVPQLQAQTTAIVVRGNFNPAIFSPGWLLAQGLIGPGDAETAQPEAIVPHISIFGIGSMRFQVTDDSFDLATTDSQDIETLRDIASGTLTILGHTPVSMLGINRTVHYSLESEQMWHAIGDVLAPKEPWNDLLNLPGLRSIAVQGVRPDQFAGRIVVTLEPSVQVHPGIFIQYNDHYVLRRVDHQPLSRADAGPIDPTETEADMTASAAKIPIALEILGNDNYFPALQRQDSLIESILRLTENS